MIGHVILCLLMATCFVGLLVAVRADMVRDEKMRKEREATNKAIQDFAKRCTAAKEENELNNLIEEAIRLVDKKVSEKQLIDIMFYCGIVRGKIMSLKKG